MFSLWELCLVADDKLRCFSFPQDSPLSVSLPQHALPTTGPMTGSCTGNRDGAPLPHGTEALALCRVSLCASVPQACLFFCGMQWPKVGFIWSEVGTYYGIVIWTLYDHQKENRHSKGENYLHLKRGIDRESDELHPKSAFFLPLPIVGTWFDFLVDIYLQPTQISGDIDCWYISNVLGQGICLLMICKPYFNFT